MVDLQRKTPAFASNSEFTRSFSAVATVLHPGVQGSILEFAGEDRLSGGNGNTNIGITGANAHAAVRMHDYQVSDSFWAFCPKFKTPLFQRWKVAY